MSSRAAARSLDLPPVAILCGGLGTRLRSAVADRPKALALVAGRPFLAWLLDMLDLHGFNRVVLCTGYGADQIEAEFGASYRGLHLLYSREPAPLGTGGAVRHALPLLGSESVAVVNGDSYCQVNLKRFWQEHVAGGADASMVLTHVDDSSRFGSVELAESGFITGFREKATQIGPAWINAGIYIVGAKLLQAIPAGAACSLERDIFPTWIERGLRGVKSSGRFIDIGTPASYAAAGQFFLSLAGPAFAQSTPHIVPIGDTV